MIVGETLTLRHEETAALPWVVSDPSASVLKPDGTTATRSVAVTPVANAVTHVLSAVLTPSTVGQYKVTWIFGDGTNTYERPEYYFASWTDIQSLVRRRLRPGIAQAQAVAGIPDALLSPEIAFVVRTIVDRFTELQTAGGYGGLAGQDQDRFDEAVALTVAAILRPILPKILNGEINLLKLPAHEFRFSPGVKQQTDSVECQWMQQAQLALGRVTVIQTAYSAAAFSPWRMSGPTRTQIANGVTQSLMQSLITLFTDDYTLQSDTWQG